ncbi:MAG: hypothetical protein WAN48_07850 [Actinomycetes bacterium]
MGDKSPRQTMGKKSSRSIKEKRADKKAKNGASSESVVIVPSKKR